MQSAFCSAVLFAAQLGTRLSTCTVAAACAAVLVGQYLLQAAAALLVLSGTTECYVKLAELLQTAASLAQNLIVYGSVYSQASIVSEDLQQLHKHLVLQQRCATSVLACFSVHVLRQSFRPCNVCMFCCRTLMLSRRLQSSNLPRVPGPKA